MQKKNISEQLYSLLASILRSFLTLEHLGFQILSLMLLSFQVHAGVCKSDYDVQQALVKPNCDAGSSIILFSEHNHFDSLIQIIRDHMADLAAQKEIYYFQEGQPKFESPSYRLGLEVQELGAFSSMLIAGPVFIVVGSNSSREIDDKTKQALYLSKLHLGDAMMSWSELLSELSQSEDVLVREIAKKFLETVVVPKTTSQWDRAIAITEAKRFLSYSVWWKDYQDYAALAHFSQAWLDLAEKKILEIPGLEFLKTGSLSLALGNGRDILFTQSVLEKYCEASREKKQIWLQIGKGHEERTSCLLREYLPAGALVKIKNVEDYKDLYMNWLEKYKTSKARESINKILESFGNKIQSESTWGKSRPYVGIITFSHKLSDEQTSTLMKVLDENGYVVLKDATFGTVLSFMPRMP